MYVPNRTEDKEILHVQETTKKSDYLNKSLIIIQLL